MKFNLFHLIGSLQKTELLQYVIFLFEIWKDIVMKKFYFDYKFTISADF